MQIWTRDLVVLTFAYLRDLDLQSPGKIHLCHWPIQFSHCNHLLVSAHFRPHLELNHGFPPAPRDDCLDNDNAL